MNGFIIYFFVYLLLPLVQTTTLNRKSLKKSYAIIKPHLPQTNLPPIKLGIRKENDKLIFQDSNNNSNKFTLLDGLESTAIIHEDVSTANGVFLSYNFNSFKPQHDAKLGMCFISYTHSIKLYYILHAKHVLL